METEYQNLSHDDDALARTSEEKTGSCKTSREIKPIGRNVAHRICSGQVVVTLAMAIKELVENSIDAQATCIDIHLIEYGSVEIQVIDNGVGVVKSNFEALTLKHHTSKLSEFEDLTSVETFGFRGEALSSLCALSNLSITTKTSTGKTGYRIDYDSNGKITSQISCARSIGTTVILKNIFQPLPVRHKEFLKNLKKEFYKMVNFLYGYCLVSKGIRIKCTNQERKGEGTKQVLAIPASDSVKERIICLFGSKQVASLMEVSDILIPDEIPSQILQEYGLTQSCFTSKLFQLEGFISKPHNGRSSTDKQFFFINSRPFESTKIAKLINEVYHTFSSRNQYPFVYLNIKTQHENVDVNVSPDKRSIFLQNEKLLYSTIKATLIYAYKSTNSQFETSLEEDSGTFNNEPEHESEAPSHTESHSANSVTESSSQFPKSNLSIFRNQFKSCAVPSSPSHSFRNKSNESESFAQQFSGVPDTSKNSMRSILTKFKFGSSNANSLSPGDFHKARQAKKNFLHGDCKRVAGTRRTVKQPKLFDFISSKQQKIESRVDFDSDCEEITEDTVDTSQKTDSQYSFSQQSISSTVISSCDRSMEIDDDAGIDFNADQMEVETNDKNDSDSTSGSLSPILKSFSQKSKAYSNSSTERKGRIEFITPQEEDVLQSQDTQVIIYDDELENHYSVKNGFHLDSTCTARVEVDVTLGELKQKLLKIHNEEEPQTNNRARRFRAKIMPGENSTAEGELKKELKQEMFSQMEILGQFNTGFIIAKHDADLFIIDQHASDEKYNFETLEKDLVLQNQKLISPMPLQLPAISENIIIDNLDCFKKNGFEFEINEDEEPTKRIKLAKMPYSKGCEFGRQDIEELVFMLEDAPEKSFCRPTKVRTMLASRACRKSVMVGDPLGAKEMKQIVQHLGILDQPWNCPHGRPTIRHLINLNLMPDMEVNSNH